MSKKGKGTGKKVGIALTSVLLLSGCFAGGAVLGNSLKNDSAKADQNNSSNQSFVELNKKYNELLAQNEEQKSTIKELEASIAELSLLQGQLREKEDEIAKLETQIATATEENKTLEQNLETAQQEKLAIEGQIADLQSKIAQLEENIRNLESSSGFLDTFEALSCDQLKVSADCILLYDGQALYSLNSKNEKKTIAISGNGEGGIGFDFSISLSSYANKVFNSQDVLLQDQTNQNVYYLYHHATESLKKIECTDVDGYAYVNSIEEVDRISIFISYSTYTGDPSATTYTISYQVADGELSIKKEEDLHLRNVVCDIQDGTYLLAGENAQRQVALYKFNISDQSLTKVENVDEKFEEISSVITSYKTPEGVILVCTSQQPLRFYDFSEDRVSVIYDNQDVSQNMSYIRNFFMTSNRKVLMMSSVRTAEGLFVFDLDTKTCTKAEKDESLADAQIYSCDTFEEDVFGVTFYNSREETTKYRYDFETGKVSRLDA